VRNIVYAYVAYNESKEIVKGKLEAKNEEQASKLLSYAGYQLINLKQMASFPTLEKLMLRMSPVKPQEIILFYRQMALLIDSGLNIVTSIELLESQTTNRIFKRVMSEIIADVRSGSQLSVALSKHPEIFSPIDCQSLKVGEQTGGMENILRQIADHLEKQRVSRKGVKNAMMLPAITMVVAVVVVAILVVFVLPAFAGIYTQLGAKMPLLMQVMLDGGAWLKANGVYALAVVIIAVVMGIAYLKTAAGRYKWDKLSLQMPMMGRINHLNELARLGRGISVLFKAGLPLTEILPLVIQSCGNKVIVESLMSIREDMLSGEGLSRPMAKHPVFLPMMVQMVRVGEETGNMDSTLLSVAQSYEAEADDRTKALIGMIQPVMTVAIALVVGLMALSMVSAMYSMYGQGNGF
jgi:type IV pilus assembly protein PilC